MPSDLDSEGAPSDLDSEGAPSELRFEGALRSGSIIFLVRTYIGWEIAL